MKPAKLLSVLLSLLTALTLLTAAIAAPILCRPFYYAHIGPLNLCGRTGLTESQIKTAYNEMLDYCLGADEFSTGVLAWSDSGKSHFTDVRGLFLLDLRLLAVSAAALAVLLILCHVRRVRLAPLLGRSFRFWAGAGLGGLFLLIGGFAALDFNRAFVVFHSLFFPGKTNWLFDPAVDQIITILPEAFFRDCAILILAILVIGCAALIASDFFHFKGISLDTKRRPW
jgi:integral membrane protein (TIGR01906 family)